MFNWQYSNVALTGTINRVPNLYGLLNHLNLFPSKSIANTVVEVRYEDGQIIVLPATERGAPPSLAGKRSGNTIYLGVPHFPHLDILTPADIQNMVTVEGDQFRPRTAEDELAAKLQLVRMKHDITREYMRMGALKGVIKDGSGKTLYDIFAHFNVTKKQVFFDLSNAAADIKGTCEALHDTIAEDLKGETMTKVEVVVSTGFFNKFVQHPKVEKYYEKHPAMLLLTGMTREPASAWGRSFEHENILFREYKGIASVKDANGAVINERFVAADMGHAYPAGTMDAFATYDAPPHHMDMVNKPGVEIYVSQKVLDHGAGIELHSQSNCLAVPRRPELLVEVSAAADPG